MWDTTSNLAAARARHAQMVPRRPVVARRSQAVQVRRANPFVTQTIIIDDTRPRRDLTPP